MKRLSYAFDSLNFNDSMVFLDFMFDRKLKLEKSKLEPLYLLDMFNNNICKQVILNEEESLDDKKNGKLYDHS